MPKDRRRARLDVVRNDVVAAFQHGARSGRAKQSNAGSRRSAQRQRRIVSRRASQRGDVLANFRRDANAVDQCSKIARLFNTSVDKIKTWNSLRSNTITAGSRLVIRGQ